MKLVTAISMAALVLAPAVGLAQAPANDAGDTKDQPGLVNKVEHILGIGGSPDTKEGASADATKSGNRDSVTDSAGNTDYPDRASVKTTDK